MNEETNVHADAYDLRSNRRRREKCQVWQELKLRLYDVQIGGL